jgi:hypothetical protein
MTSRNSPGGPLNAWPQFSGLSSGLGCICVLLEGVSRNRLGRVGGWSRGAGQGWGRRWGTEGGAQALDGSLASLSSRGTTAPTATGLGGPGSGAGLPGLMLVSGHGEEEGTC